jgi:hypothetical protein
VGNGQNPSDTTVAQRSSEEDKAAEERRKHWDMKSRTPLLITLHKDEGRIPGSVRLQMHF